jgi:hypothetical protein
MEPEEEYKVLSMKSETKARSSAKLTKRMNSAFKTDSIVVGATDDHG